MKELESFNKEKAKQLYEDGCNAYLQLFCEKHEFDFEDAIYKDLTIEAKWYDLREDYILDGEKIVKYLKKGCED